VGCCGSCWIIRSLAAGCLGGGCSEALDKEQSYCCKEAGRSHMSVIGQLGLFRADIGQIYYTMLYQLV
jgi:hypothetical protein